VVTKSTLVLTVIFGPRKGGGFCGGRSYSAKQGDRPFVPRK